MTGAMNNFFGSLTMNGAIHISQVVEDNAKVTTQPPCFNTVPMPTLRRSKSDTRWDAGATPSSYAPTKPTSNARWEALSSEESYVAAPIVRATTTTTTTMNTAMTMAQKRRSSDTALTLPQRQYSLRELLDEDDFEDYEDDSDFEDEDDNVEYHEEEQSQQVYVQPSKSLSLSASSKSNVGSTTRIPLSSFKFRLPSMDSVTYDKPQKRTHTSRSNVNNVNQFLDEALGMVLSSTSSH